MSAVSGAAQATCRTVGGWVLPLWRPVGRLASPVALRWHCQCAPVGIPQAAEPATTS